MYDFSSRTFAVVPFSPSGGCFEYEAVVCSPSACFRHVAILLRRQLVPMVVRTSIVSAGLWLKLQAPQSSYLYLSSLQLPHRQRDDCEHVWHETLAETHSFLSSLRHFDHIVIGIDANVELCNACDGTLRLVYARNLVHDFGLTSTTYSWQSHVVELSCLLQNQLHTSVWAVE